MEIQYVEFAQATVNKHWSMTCTKTSMRPKLLYLLRKAFQKLFLGYSLTRFWSVMCNTLRIRVRNPYVEQVKQQMHQYTNDNLRKASSVYTDISFAELNLCTKI